MRQVAVLVEGRTEECLVEDVLGPIAEKRGLYLVPIVVTTSATPTRAYRGGGHWKHYDSSLRGFLGQGHWYRVALLVDYYQYPKGAPGRDCEGLGEGRQRKLVRELRRTYPDPCFRPFVVLHEVETLVLAAIDAGQGDGWIPRKGLAALRRAVKEAGGPECVDDGPATSPSKRLEKADPNYMKTVTGPLLIAQAGLGAVLERCPVFAEWWEDLLA